MTEVFKAKTDDIFDIIRLEKDAFPLDPWDESMLMSAFSHDFDHLLIARNDERVLGYAWLRIIDTAELMRIAVESASRRQGTGYMLLSRAIALARHAGAGELLLELRADNAAALRLYEKAGFGTVSVRRGYYHKPSCDALIMRYIC